MIIPEEEIRTSPPCDVVLMAYTSSNSQDSTVTTDCATYVLLRFSRKIQDSNLEKCAFANREKPKARADDVVTIMFKTMLVEIGNTPEVRLVTQLTFHYR